MQIDLDTKIRIAEIYLSRQDQEDPEIQAQLSPLYQEYKAKGYMVAVYRSGSKDLTRQTSDLLCHNRKSMARQAVVSQREQTH